MFNLVSEKAFASRNAHLRGFLRGIGHDANCIFLPGIFRKLQNGKQGESLNFDKTTKNALAQFKLEDFQEGETVIGKSLWVTNGET